MLVATMMFWKFLNEMALCWLLCVMTMEPCQTQSPPVVLDFKYGGGLMVAQLKLASKLSTTLANSQAEGHTYSIHYKVISFIGTLNSSLTIYFQLYQQVQPSALDGKI